MQHFAKDFRIYTYMNEQTMYLIGKCRKRDHAAQVSIYKLYVQRLYATCLRITGNPAEAEEAVQDSFLKAFNRIDQYQDGQNFEAWLQTITIHTAIDYVRKQTPDWTELPPNMAIPEEEETDEENVKMTVEKIKEGVKKLPAGYRAILSLYLFEGYDMEEISSIMDIQHSSVRSQYLRAKRKLLEIIATN